jgi:predicted transcriptional regulator
MTGARRAGIGDRWGPVNGGTSIASAELEMNVAGFRHLPVVAEHENVIGILSKPDLLRARPGHRRSTRWRAAS